MTKAGVKMAPVRLQKVAVHDEFWAPRIEKNRAVTLPIEYRQCKKTGRIDAWKLDWKEGAPNKPHQFWDSDVAKWIEAAAYSLAAFRDEKLEKTVDGVIDWIAKAQQKDGYLNTYFTVCDPGRRWTNLRDMHELYCAGHLMEAAAAYYEATGKRKLLDVLCRYADYIASVFGPEKGKKRGYPGHEEIELALVKLYRATGRGRYLKLAKFFIDQRGRRPHFFDQEARARGEDPKRYGGGGYENLQAHRPVREQATAEGHAVRAMYLYCGMADVAAETGDAELLAACRRLWKNVAERRMYIHGGIGSTRFGERFTCDYDLPNEEAYAETCAAIGLVFWSHRMLQIDADSKYADVMERAFYNGTISGVSLDGKRFFYDNLLAVHPKTHRFRERKSPFRQEWFGCACCPPNIARLLASLPQYVYSRNDREAYVHLYVGSTAELEVAGQTVRLAQRTGYPWKEKVMITVNPERREEFTLALRIPGWCRGAKLELNGASLSLRSIVRKGYAKIKRTWKRADKVRLTLPMPVERIEAHPSVREDCGKVALQRGPVVYCLEQVDNGPDLADICLPRNARLKAKFTKNLLGGVVVVSADAYRRDRAGWKGALYKRAPSATRRIRIKAVPYCVWGNRKEGEMIVWMREC